MHQLETNTSITNAYMCNGCGAPLTYKPGTSHLACTHCGNTQNIDQKENVVEELNFEKYIANFEKENLSTTKVVTCSNCKATPTVDENLRSMHCPYCSSPLIETNVHQERYIKPGYVSPFQIDRTQTNKILTDWVKGLWFAPNKLQRAILDSINLNGIYIPFWTYDANTSTSYSGERGIAYYTTVGSGKNKTTVRRVRWSNVSGVVSNFYDDVLIPGSRTLDTSILSEVGGWDTHNILEINDSYLAGFVTEKYQIDLKEGFSHAQEEIENGERYSVRQDIGGDEQRIHSMDVQVSDVTFKHVLLPLYVSAFRYKDKLYTFYINGSTGRIAGKRPYSTIKIVLAVIAGIIAAVGIIWLFGEGQGGY